MVNNKKAAIEYLRQRTKCGQPEPVIAQVWNRYGKNKGNTGQTYAGAESE